MSIDQLSQQIWNNYIKKNPQAEQIHDLFNSMGEKIVIDHFGLRTFSHSAISLAHLSDFFSSYGYKESGIYNFPAKKVFAKHYEHENVNYPKVFISELMIEQFSQRLQTIVQECIEKIPKDITNSERLLYSGVFWNPLSYKIYQELLSESEYAAWIYVFGFGASQFTMNINSLSQFNSIDEVNHFLLDHNFKINSIGGLVKGSIKEHLVQSSTIAKIKYIDFEEGSFPVPSSYYGFAKRYMLPNGKLYTGFVATSADKIFESTHSCNII